MQINKAFEKVHYLTIDVNREAQRIDNFLVSYLKNVPKSKIYQIIRKGEVRVNKKRIKPDYKLQVGDEVRIPPVFRTEQRQMSPSDSVKKVIEEAIIFNTPTLIILNKPSGIPVHGGTGLTGGVVNILRVIFEEYKFIELVHRLDKETSGCLVLAKTRAALLACQEAWKQNKVEKYYYCLVEGRWPASLQEVAAPIVKNQLQSGERMVRVDAAGKPSLTYFKPIEYFPHATLLEAKLATGRTHQIRVHAAHAGHPIAGDDKYGNKQFNRLMRELGLNRLFLHANKLILPTECFEEQVVEASLPDELADFLLHLRTKK